jgi:hypothetical protein
LILLLEAKHVKIWRKIMSSSEKLSKKLESLEFVDLANPETEVLSGGAAAGPASGSVSGSTDAMQQMQADAMQTQAAQAQLAAQATQAQNAMQSASQMAQQAKS